MWRLNRQKESKESLERSRNLSINYSLICEISASFIFLYHVQLREIVEMLQILTWFPKSLILFSKKHHVIAASFLSLWFFFFLWTTKYFCFTYKCLLNGTKVSLFFIWRFWSILSYFQNCGFNFYRDWCRYGFELLLFWVVGLWLRSFEDGDIKIKVWPLTLLCSSSTLFICTMTNSPNFPSSKKKKMVWNLISTALSRKYHNTKWIQQSSKIAKTSAIA